VDLSQVPLFALADRRLAWVATRQSLLAQNIANTDTPGWQARDVAPFATALGSAGMNLAQTVPGHFTGTAAGSAAVVVNAAEHAPDGNSVALDKELAKIADTDSAHEVATGLTKKYLAMFRIAIGR
jgi:flagellar basal-body rod protein FlgB